ncbi:MAG: hypothetical protein DRQ78_07160 [Epsilonproteobacteria bacterium]|nr:MAG: hypothetical protein DRQ78_07160 [Campylobacterota bacterium]
MSTTILFTESIATPLAGPQNGEVAIFAYLVGSYSNTIQQIDTVSFASESNATNFFEYGDVSYITNEGFYMMFSVSNGTHAIIGGGEHIGFSVQFGNHLYKYEFKSQSDAQRWGDLYSHRSACGSLGDGVYGYMVGGIMSRMPGDHAVSYFPSDCSQNIDIITLDSSFSMNMWSSLQYTTFHMTCVSDNKTIGIIAGGVDSTCYCHDNNTYYECEESIYVRSLSKIEYSSTSSNSEFNELSTPRIEMAGVGNDTAGVLCAGGDMDDLDYNPMLDGARPITSAEKIIFSSLGVNHSFGSLEIGGFLGGASNGGAYGLVAGNIELFTRAGVITPNISKVDIDTDALTHGWGFLTDDRVSDFTVGAGSYTDDVVIPPQPELDMVGFELYTFLTFDGIDFDIGTPETLPYVKLLSDTPEEE